RSADDSPSDAWSRAPRSRPPSRTSLTTRRSQPAPTSSSMEASPACVSSSDGSSRVSLRVALVGGPMYDHLYDAFAADVEVIVHADHPTLNRAVARMLAAGERIDVCATHSKYAPSQAPWLRPLDDLIDAVAVAPLAPRAVSLCRFEGAQLCVPRLV